MDADVYQEKTAETELYSEAAINFLDESTFTKVSWLELAYCTGKLNGEAGEAAEIVFKAFRGSAGNLSGDEKHRLQKELGDILWYVARISDLLGVPLSEIMKQNLDKLADRKDRGVLHGSGDER